MEKCFRIKVMGEDKTSLVVSDSITNAIKNYCEKTNTKESLIFDICNLGDIIV